MFAKRKGVMLLAILLLVVAACDVIPSATMDKDVVATLVAATLSAVDDEESPPDPSEVVPTDVPPEEGGEPTDSEPPASATPEPGSPDPTSLPGDSSPTDTPEPFVAPTHALKVAYVKDNNVWYWEEGGSPRQLTDSGDVLDVRLSYDAQKVVYIVETDSIHHEMLVVYNDGSGRGTLVSGDDFDAMLSTDFGSTTIPYQYDWVPGTHRVVFNTQVILEGPGLILQDDLHMVGAGVPPSTPTSVLAPGEGGAFTFSPDGSKMALVRRDQISVLNFESEEQRDLLSFLPVLTQSEYSFYPSVFWNLGSSALRVAIPPENPFADPAAETEVYHVPIDGSPNRIIARIAIGRGFQSGPFLSPDAEKMVYLEPSSPGYGNLLKILEFEIDHDLIYDSGDVRFLGWSMDNKHFLFTLDGNPRLGRRGAPPQPLSGITSMVNVSWVDPSRYLYLSKNGSFWELWLGTRGGSPVRIDSAGLEIIVYDSIK